MKRRCPQCWRMRPANVFLSDAPGAQCGQCRANYRLPPSVRPAREWRSTQPETGPILVRFTLRSSNAKTGPIPVSTSSPHTCPPSCSWYGAGCYAEQNHMGARWRQMGQGGPTILIWALFCEQVRQLPEGQLWRHNEAGDLPGDGEEIFEHMLERLVEANRGRRGFTYTHKRGPGLDHFNAAGFTINLSCDSHAHLLATRAQYPGLPLVTVVPSTENRRAWVRDGLHHTLCPAEVEPGMTCQRCRLCAVPTRKTVVAFRSHGGLGARMDERLVQLSLFGTGSK